MKILMFAAALRKDSFNRKLLANAVASVGRSPEFEIDVADFRTFEMPIYDGDVETDSGIPIGAQELIKRIEGAQALIISTPEYNGGIPGALKNAIDWVSRKDPIPLEGKPLLLLSASPGALGGVRGLWHSRVPFEAIGALVFPEMFGLPRAHQAFDHQNNLTDPKTVDRLNTLVDSYLDFVEKITNGN